MVKNGETALACFFWPSPRGRLRDEGIVMRRVWIAGGVLILLAAAGFGYQALTGPARSQTPAEPHSAPAVPVVVAEVKRQAMPVQLTAVGTVQTISSVAIKSRVDGQITEVAVKDGQSVKAGDVLFKIDPRLAQAQLDQMVAQVARDHAQLVNAQRDVGRYKPLAEKEFVSRQQLDTSSTTAEAAGASVKADEASVENARVSLSFYTITAPIDGRIGYVNLKLGNDIKANDVPLATLNQIRPIYVNFPLPQVNLPQVRNAMAARAVEVDAQPQGDKDAPAKGRLTFFENTIDPTTGTIVMRATFDNNDERLWPGEFVTVTVDLAVEPDALTVPSVAVQLGQKENYVYVIKPDNTAEYRPVAVDRALGALTVIAKGLNPGERVVTDGQLRITDGARVSIRATEGAAKPGDNS
jgi:membrane fusion protein, multidrug efflux system